MGELVCFRFSCDGSSALLLVCDVFLISSGDIPNDHEKSSSFLQVLSTHNLNQLKFGRLWSAACVLGQSKRGSLVNG